MYLSRGEVERKYKISITRQRQLEKKGKLTPLDPSKVGYEQRDRAPGGPTVKVVYDEAQVAALKAKTSSDVRFARQQRRDAVVFDMIKEGVDVPDIVMRTRLDLAVVKRLWDEYIRAKDGFVVPGEVRRIAREHGIDLRPDNIADIFISLLAYGRSEKPLRARQIVVVPDE